MVNPYNGFRILRFVVDGALVVLIAVVLFGVFLGRIVPLTDHQTLVIDGGSMEPAIHVGSVVVDETVGPDGLHVGDVVTLHSGPRLQSVFTHRITRIVDRPDGLWIETKGDANQDVDPSITPLRQVIGRVVLTVPDAGYLVQWLSIPSGIVATICIAAALFVLALVLESLEQEFAPVRRPSAAPGPVIADVGESGAVPVAPRRISAVLAAAREARERRSRWLAGTSPDRPPSSTTRATGDRSIE
ncbi:MAG: signal peptidase I [Candidatus Limnocylindrales bacterium]